MERLGELNAVAHYTLAYAHRRQRDFEAARWHVSQAIAKVRVADDPSVHDTYVRERELIDAAAALEDDLQDVRRLRKEIEDMRDELLCEHDRAVSLVSGQLVKMVEVLGLFTSVAAFVFASIQIISADQSLRDRLILLGAFGASLMLFVLLLVVILRMGLRHTNPRARAPRQPSPAPSE